MKFVFFLLFIFTLVQNMNAQDPNFHIYIAFGQSNMEGTGAIESMDLTVNDRFQVYQALDCPDAQKEKGNWYPAVPPLVQCHSDLSPADYFGRTMVEQLPDCIRVGIVVVAIGG